MLRRTTLALAMLLGATAASIAQTPPPVPLPLPFPSFQGTESEQKACQPAVFKFCQQALPDTFRILNCLQQNRPRIGKLCQQVLSSHGV